MSRPVPGFSPSYEYASRWLRVLGCRECSCVVAVIAEQPIPGERRMAFRTLAGNTDDPCLACGHHVPPGHSIDHDYGVVKSFAIFTARYELDPWFLSMPSTWFPRGQWHKREEDTDAASGVDSDTDTDESDP